MSTQPETVPAASLPLRPEIVGEEPYGAPQLDVPVQLNVNENPYPPSDAVVASVAAAVTEAARGLNRYPDREFRALRSALAVYLEREAGVTGLDADHLWAANGSNEVMLHLLQAFGGPGRTALSFAPTYSMYPEYARDTSTAWVAGRRAEDFTLDADHACELIARVRPSVVLLPSPNNPTGTALPLETVRRILDVARTSGPLDGTAGATDAADLPATSTVVVIDEAYAEFRREGTPSALTLLADNPHLAVTRTMSKAFGMAGARLGYLAAAPALVDALRIVRLPYHLSAVTQAVALAALAHTDELMGQVAGLRAERDALVDWFAEQGLDAVPSDANFVLFGRFADRDAVWTRLLERGVLIRQSGPDGWLRVSVGTPEETAAFKAALVEVLGA
ncbi:MAG: histidinol-phosphate transaminase [Micrococcales bacterium 73-15]|uniref:histidinol-phosphate transaminase n=1 Tax=Salana multivorans TaxID=120377 RepID=UPI00095AA5CF|nr:histidinol-phosphate transaminase [Salana multivorans]OJX95589.1 MAG: histidinol-phosphate transaminase [Micrococcales bacterium 73-15]